jgi:hypothetical protein
MADTTHVIGSSGVVKRLIDLGDGTYADAVADVAPALSTETVVAGAASVLGKLATLAENEVVYVRCATDPARDVEWRVKADKIHAVQLYKARTIVDSVDITLNAIADTNEIYINGLLLTGKANAAAAHAHDRYFSVDASGNDADAVVLAALINADYAVVTAGTSIAATDKLVITTDEGAHTIVAAAAADYPAGKYGLNATVGTELASIILAINHKGSVTCVANPTVGDTVTVGGQVYTFATTEDTATHAPTRVGTADQIGISLAACINADTTLQTAHGISASNTAGVVTLTRTTSTPLGLSSSNGTKLTVEQPGGVPGVLAAGGVSAGELTITPTWTKVLTVTEAGDQLTVTDIDIPGVLATAGTAKVTLTPGTPAGTDGELASVIQTSGTATRTGHSQATTLAGLVKHGAAVAAIAANNTTAGTIYSQESKGWEYCYIGVTNTSGDASVMTLVVGATKG